MSIFNYSLNQINECYNYQKLCDMFIGLAKDAESKIILEEILYNGKYKEYNFNTSYSSKDNPDIEAQRRISMAYLFIKNPETFYIMAEENINLFHGTNANALPSILKYGLNSGFESESQGIEVTTGEHWSRLGGKQRNFISLTDVLDVAEHYSFFSKDAEFEVIIGTTVDDALKSGITVVRSDTPEVGIKNKIPVENISLIGVPSDKVDFVKGLVDNDNIKVVAMDVMKEKCYWFDSDCNGFEINYDEYEKLKNTSTKEKGFSFKPKEIIEMMISRLFPKIAEQANVFDNNKEIESEKKH